MKWIKNKFRFTLLQRFSGGLIRWMKVDGEWTKYWYIDIEGRWGAMLENNILYGKKRDRGVGGVGDLECGVKKAGNGWMDGGFLC